MHMHICVYMHSYMYIHVYRRQGARSGKDGALPMCSKHQLKSSNLYNEISSLVRRIPKHNVHQRGHEFSNRQRRK